MNELASHDENTLRSELSQARERLDGLVRDLHATDSELEGLSVERRQHQLLSDACGALEELRELGGAGLFWNEPEPGAERRTEEHVRVVRGRVDAFEKRLSEIETRREAVAQEIALARDDAEVLEDDIYEIQRQEEERKLEWIVERDVGDLPGRPAVMPWARGFEDDQRFRKSLAASLLLSLLLGLLLPMIDLPLPDRWEPLEVPDRFTRLIREERPLPPPPPPVQQAETKPDEKEPELVEESTEPEAAPEQKETPASKGILAFREKFSALADSKPAARLGAQARIQNSGEAAVGRAGRSMVATQAPGSSGGINLAALSRDVGNGNGQIQGIEVARATSSIGEIAGEERPLSDGPGPARTDEEIQIVFDRHKAALYRLYNRELRRDPTLQGQMVLRITIEPDGTVSLCELHSTDMKAPTLSAQVVGRVRAFDFGAKEGISVITILYPIDFLPAT